MNKNYRVVWNDALGTWIVASELAKGRTKSTSTKNILLTAAVALSLGGFANAFTEIVEGEGVNIAADKVEGVGQVQTVRDHGKTTNTSLVDGGAQIVENTGTSDGTFVYGRGNASQGYKGSKLHINAGGTANGTQLGSFGEMVVEGVANNTHIYQSANAKITVESGGILNKLTSERGTNYTLRPTILVNKGGKMKDVDLWGFATVDLHGTADQVYVGKGSKFNIHETGVATDVTLAANYSDTFLNIRGKLENLTVDHTFAYNYINVNTGELTGKYIEQNTGYVSEFYIYGGDEATGISAGRWNASFINDKGVKESAVANQAFIYIGDYSKDKKGKGELHDLIVSNVSKVDVYNNGSTHNVTIQDTKDYSPTQKRGFNVRQGGLVVDTTIKNTGRMTVYNGARFGGVTTVEGIIEDGGEAFTYVTIEDGGKLTYNQKATDFAETVINFGLVGDGGFVQNGDNIVRLAGTNTYTGTTEVLNGTLAGTFSHQSDIVIGAKGTILFDEDKNVVINGNITGTGKIDKTGDGNLTVLDGPKNTFAGTWNIGKGSLIGHAGALKGNILNNSRVEFNDLTGATTFTGKMTGTGIVDKTGAGTAIIDDTAVFDHTGGTFVKEGVLQGNASSFKSNMVVEAGAKLLFDQSSKEGTLNNNISGAGTVGTVGTGTLNVDKKIDLISFEHNGGKLNIKKDGKLNLAGALTVSTNTDLIFNDNGTLHANTVNLADGSKVSLVTTGALESSYTLITTTKGITANIDNITLTVNGAIISSTVTEAVYRSANFGLANGNKDLVYSGKGLVWFHDDVNKAHGTFQVDGSATDTISEKLTVRTDIPAGNGFGWTGNTLKKKGTGTLTLTGDNEYTGSTTVEAGKLVMTGVGKSSQFDVNGGELVGNTNNLNSGNIATVTGTKVTFDQASNGTYGKVVSGAGILEKTGTGELTLTGNNTVEKLSIKAGSVKGNTNSIQGDVALAGKTNVTFNQTANGTYGKVISGEGKLVKAGAGELTLSGVNTHKGGTDVNAGKLTSTTANLSTGAVAVGDKATLAINGAGTLANKLSGAGTLEKSGAGKLIVNNVESIGGINVKAGGLTLDHTGTLSLKNNLELANNTSLDIKVGTDASIAADKLVLGSNVTLDLDKVADSAGVVNDKFEKQVLISSTNGITGDFTNVTVKGQSIDDAITADTYLTAKVGKEGNNIVSTLGLVWNSTSAKAHGTFKITDNTTFTVTSNLDVKTATTGWDGNSLIKSGLGTLILAGNNEYTGSTTVDAGKLTLTGTGKSTQFKVNSGELVGNVTNLGSGAIDIKSDAQVTFDQASDGAYSKVISGGGNVTKEGAGALTLSGDNAYAGTTTINDGKLTLTGAGVSTAFNVNKGELIGHAGNLSAGDIAVKTGTKVTFNQTANGTYGKVISGDGAVVKAGAGNLTLTGVNTHKGGTSINAGQLTANKGALGTGAVSVNNTANLQLTGAATIANEIKGTGNLLKADAGKITLSQLGNIGSISVTAGDLYIHQDKTVTVTKDVNVANGSTLGVDMRAKPTIIADKVNFGATGSTLDIVNFDSSANGVNLVETTSGVSGKYDVTVAGNALANNVTLDVYAVGEVKTEGNNIVVRNSSLVWNYNDADKAHGTFNVGGTSEGIVSETLKDRADITSSNTFGWDGKSLTKTGTGTLTLAKDNAYTGETTVDDGKLVLAGKGTSSKFTVKKGELVGNTTNLNSGNIDVATSAKVTFKQASAGTYGKVVAGAGDVAKEGAGALTLSGANTYTGATTVNDGKLILTGDSKSTAFNVNKGELVGNASNLNSGNTTVATGAKVTFDQVAAGTYSKTVSGAGTFEKKGAGALTLDATASIDTDVTLTAGTLKGKASNIKGNVNTATNSKLELTEGSFAKDITGTGELVKSGANKLTLTGTKANTVGVNLTVGALEGHAGNLTGAITAGTGTTLTFNQQADGALDATITGTGIVEKIGTAKLNVASNNTLDNLTVTQGAVAVANGSKLNVTNDLNVGANGVLDVSYDNSPSITAGSASFTAGSTINLDKIGSDFPTDQVLLSTTGGVTGAYKVTVGGTALNTDVTSTDDYTYGTVGTAGNDIKANIGLAWNHASTSHGTFNVDPAGESFTLDINLADNTNGTSHAFGWNGADLTKEGAGTLILNGQNTYTGTTFANNGQLIIGGDATKSTASINSDVIVANNALLGGHGSIIGQVTVQSGGTISPGTSIGTLSAGSVHFESGSSLVIEADTMGGIDQLAVSSTLGGDGKVTIDAGANLTINSLAGVWNPSQSYTIITADGGISGTFTNVTKDTLFLNHDVVYNANDIVLNVTRNDVTFDNLGRTYNQKQTAYAIEHLGLYNPIYQEIAWMTDGNQVRAAYDMLSGEIHASAKAALLNNAQFSRNAIYSHLAGNTPSSIENGRELWINLWGQSGNIDGNRNAAKLKNEGWGFLIGSDLFSNEQMRFGVALGYEQNDLKVNARNSKAESEGVHLMAYGQALFDQFELSGGIGYNWQKLDTKRNVSVGSLHSQNNAKYDANVFQLFMKGQYNIEVDSNLTVSPYLALAYQSLKTDNFREGGNYSNLVGTGKTDNLWTTSLGVNGKYKIADQGELYADVAWKHNSKSRYTSSLRFDSGYASYKVKGVNLSKDTGVIGVGGAFNVSPDTKVSFGYEGEFGNKTKNNSFKLQFQHIF